MTTESPVRETTASEPAYDPAAALLARLAGLRDRVALLVEHRSADDPTASDPLRGLYLSEEAVRHLLRPAEPPHADHFGTAGLFSTPTTADDRLTALCVRLGLTELDAALLLIALAPDLDRTFEPLYGYLNDDVSRRRATVGARPRPVRRPRPPGWARGPGSTPRPRWPRSGCSAWRSPNAPSSAARCGSPTGSWHTSSATTPRTPRSPAICTR